MSNIAKEIGFTKDEFKTFWDLYYPVCIYQDISEEDAQKWQDEMNKKIIPLSRLCCPYCLVNKLCGFCEYGKIQGICTQAISGYHKAITFWKTHKIIAIHRKKGKFINRGANDN